MRKELFTLVRFCSNFDFACSSATSNIEPLGIEEAFLKDPFLPLFSQQTLWSASTNSFGYICHWTVFNTIKEKMKDKGAILPFQYLWTAAFLEKVVKFPPSPSALCLRLTYHPLTSKSCVPSPWCFTLSSSAHSLSKIRWKIHRELM